MPFGGGIGRGAGGGNDCADCAEEGENPPRAAVAAAVCPTHADAVADLVRHRVFLLRDFHLAAQAVGGAGLFGGENV